MVRGKAFVELLKDSARRGETAFFIEQSKVPDLRFDGFTHRKETLAFLTPEGKSIPKEVYFTDVNIGNIGLADALNPQLIMRLLNVPARADNLERALYTDRMLGRIHFVEFRTRDESPKNEELAVIISIDAMMKIPTIQIRNVERFVLGFSFKDDDVFYLSSNHPSLPTYGNHFSKEMTVRFGVNASNFVTEDLTPNEYRFKFRSWNDVEIVEVIGELAS